MGTFALNVFFIFTFLCTESGSFPDMLIKIKIKYFSKPYKLAVQQWDYFIVGIGNVLQYLKKKKMYEDFAVTHRGIFLSFF